MIRRVLIPTDFSEVSRHAIEAGLAFARNYGASVSLLHVQEQHAATWIPGKSKATDQAADYESAMRKLEEILQASDTEDLEVSLHVKGGKFLSAIKEVRSELKIDLVVLGSHGASGLNELLIGSNTQRIIRTLDVCALVIKNKLSSVDFKNIVFSSSFREEEQPAFDRFMQMFPETEANIHLLSINTLGYQSLTASMARANMFEYIKAYPHHTFELHIYPQQWIEPGIRAFADQIKADLIAITNTNPSPLRRIFAGSTVESLINHSNLPILSISF